MKDRFKKTATEKAHKWGKWNEHRSAIANRQDNERNEYAKEVAVAVKQYYREIKEYDDEKKEK